MKRTTMVLVLCAALIPAVAGAIEAGRWGVHVQVYGEPHEPDRPVYVNVLPLVYEAPVSSRLSLKVGTIFGLRVADSISVGNVGLAAALPVYPSGTDDGLAGLFVGPIVLASYNMHTDEIVVSTAVDAGYSLVFDGPFSLTLGGELGVSVFFSDTGVALRPHYGPAVYFYFDRHRAD